MAKASGIGTYLRQTVPRIFIRERGMSPALLGDIPVLESLPVDPSVSPRFIDCQAPIYSVREQFALRRAHPADTDLFWSPHYNIPLSHRGKLVVTVHDVLHLARPDFVRGRHRTMYSRAMFEAVRRKAAAVICVSAFSADELTRLTGIGRQQISVIHNGVDSSWFSARSPERPWPTPYFVYVGNVKPHKNLARLIRAFGSVAAGIPHDLVIVGRRDGFITGAPDVAVEAERLGPRIHFAGELSEDEVRNFVGHAEALVFPSLYEGFGLPALEAMAAGTPVIASRAASIPEVCGAAALYFDPEDEAELGRSIQKVAREPAALREELVAAGLEQAKKFSWERSAEATADVLLSAAR